MAGLFDWLRENGFLAAFVTWSLWQGGGDLGRLARWMKSKEAGQNDDTPKK